MEYIDYSPRGYWSGSAAISKLSDAAKVKKATAANWISKQAIWQIYLPRPKQINFSHFDVIVPKLENSKNPYNAVQKSIFG